MSNSPDFDDLVEQALVNAQEDRQLTMEAFKKMEPIFDIDSSNTETLQSVMLVGAQAVKLLEQLSRTNEQIIKLSQLRQKEKPDTKRAPIDISELKLSFKEHGS